MKASAPPESSTGRTARAHARARKEILVSSGAYNSPQLLQLSGVGPADLLKSHGIDVVLDAPGVGNDLQDHMQVRIVMRCSQPITLNDIVNHPGRRIMAGTHYAALRKGPLTIAAGTSGAFFKTDPRLASPDVQIHFLPFSTDKMGEKLHPYSAFSASVCQVRPESRGTLRIKSADPMAAPEIRINYLATETDRTVNVEGLKILRKILAAPALKPFVVEDRRVAQLEAEGVRMRTGVNVTDLGQLSHDAVLLATGALRGRDVTTPGRSLEGVHLAMEHLIQSNRFVAFGEQPSITAAGKHVLIIGGGDTGADCSGWPIGRARPR